MIFPPRHKSQDLRHAFEIALEDAAAELGVAVRGRDASTVFALSFGLSDSAPYVASPTLVSAYRADERRRPRSELPSLEEAVAELSRSVKPGLSVSELRRIRRRFALQLHPDRFPPAVREKASEAMALANAKIDRALQLAARVGRGK